MNDPELKKLGLYEARAPRYTSYPTALQFTPEVGPTFSRQALSTLPIETPVSLYLHIPFCERLCWFCACRTQGTQSVAPVAAYLKHLLAEIDLVANNLPQGIKAGRIHWGGGTPTILSPEQTRQLATHLQRVIPVASDHEFSVEIDPTLVNQAKINALAEMGMTRASIGVQDFAGKVQSAIGRPQSFEITQKCISMLRAAKINSLNIDILYGLPHQTENSVKATIDRVLTLSPDRIALYGYAHVPWMAKRQQMIDETALPDNEMRFTLFDLMASKLEKAGYVPIGIDHFAKPTDSMAIASKTGNLRRNFQGYTTDTMGTLIGLGASSISKFPNGYSQNASKSSDYIRAVEKKQLATYRGIETSQTDRIIARTIEMIMCGFSVNYDALIDEFGQDLSCITETIELLKTVFANVIVFSDTGFEIVKNKRRLARLVAKEFDQYINDGMKFSSVC